MASECPSLGSVKDRYMAVAKGEATQQDGNDDDQVDNAPVDKNGMKIERSGGKEEVVKSSDGVGNIRARFGSIGKTSWKKTSQDSDTSTVDIQAVNSARSKFQSLNQKSEDEQQKSVHRPTSRKVKDPKELMEMRKKVTYGDDEEIPEDGVIKKSVVIDESELADCNRKDAINKYEELQKAVENADNTPTNKPKNRLLSDDDAKLELNKRSDSLSGSETGEGDISGDVSGYEGSVSPCSPTSEMSDDYISDTPKDEKVLDGGDETFEPLEAEVTAE